jgi:hypothetical protein
VRFRKQKHRFLSSLAIDDFADLAVLHRPPAFGNQTGLHQFSCGTRANQKCDFTVGLQESAAKITAD